MAEHGVKALRVGEVAARAGVGKATIYRRYRSKDDLVADAFGALVDEQIEVPDSGSTRDDLLTLALETTELYTGTLGAKLLPSLIDEMSRREGLASARDRFMTERRKGLRVVFERGIARGDLRHDLDLEFALDVLAGPLFYRLLVTNGPIDEALASATVELILRGFAPESPRRSQHTKKRHNSK